MNVYPIHESAGYDGSGLALATIKDGKAKTKPTTGLFGAKTRASARL